MSLCIGCVAGCKPAGKSRAVEHSCALIMTVATRGGVSSPIGGWQPTMYSVSSRPGGTEAGGGGLGHNSHSWGHGSSSGGSSSSRHMDNGTPGNILGLFAPVS